MSDLSILLPVPQFETVIALRPETRHGKLTGPTAAAFALLAVASTPAHAGNAIVIDFAQGRLILGWLGLWVLAVLAFMLFADKRTDPLARLARYLDARALRARHKRADDAVLTVAQDDPRIMADIRAALSHGDALADALPAVSMAEAAEPVQPAFVATTTMAARGFATTPMPGLPAHVQYLPA